MSVVVRMGMPENCFECNFHCVGQFCDGMGYCSAVPPYCDDDCRPCEEKRPSWCPIICSIPKGHGRLIDADSMEKEVCNGCVHGEQKYANCIDCALANAPTIVPAERKE